MPLIKSGSLAFRYEFEKHRNPGLSESELKEIKEFWGNNYTAKVRKFLLDFIHHSEKKHT